MDKGRLWDDLWWVSLHILSRVFVFVWIVFSILMCYLQPALVYWETQNIILVPVTFIWTAVMSRIGLEWIRFYWNKILQEEHKFTTQGK